MSRLSVRAESLPHDWYYYFRRRMACPGHRGKLGGFTRVLASHCGLQVIFLALTRWLTNGENTIRRVLDVGRSGNH